MKMTSKDRAKIVAFIDYARDSEGMAFNLCRDGERWVARPCKAYDPQVVAAVKRNFNEEWRAFQ